MGGLLLKDLIATRHHDAEEPPDRDALEATRPPQVVIEMANEAGTTRLPSRAPRGAAGSALVLGVLTAVCTVGCGGVQALGEAFGAWVSVAAAVALLGLPILAGVIASRMRRQQIALSRTCLRIRQRGRTTTIPLEAIQALDVVERSGSGHLNVRTQMGSQEICFGLFDHELVWIRAWIRLHVLERRADLLAEGHDPDAIRYDLPEDSKRLRDGG